MTSGRSFVLHWLHICGGIANLLLAAGVSQGEYGTSIDILVYSLAGIAPLIDTKFHTDNTRPGSC